MRSMNRLLVIFGLLSLGAVPALGQVKQDSSAPPVGLQRCTPDTRGMHTTKAEVIAIDSNTGLVRLRANGQPLVLQFPPSSLAGIKPGETITVHLGFTKGS